MIRQRRDSRYLTDEQIDCVDVVVKLGIAELPETGLYRLRVQHLFSVRTGKRVDRVAVFVFLNLQAGNPALRQSRDLRRHHKVTQELGDSVDKVSDALDFRHSVSFKNATSVEE